MKSLQHVIATILTVTCLTPACSTIPNRPTDTSTNIKKSGRSPASWAGAGESSSRRERRRNALLIKLREDATPEQVAALKALYGQLDLRNEKYFLRKGTARWQVASLTHQDQEEQVADLIKATGAVVYAEPDYVVPHALVPNDPDYNNQWYHARIGSESAWNYTVGNTSVQVAVCDSGFDLSHPELASKFVLPGYNTVKGNSQIDAINEHGTITSGVIGALGNNNTGIAGMAWQIRLLPIQISDRADGASTYSDIVECIDYAKDHGAKVVNISYDYTYVSSAISDAAASLRDAGGLVVVAAGNGASDISSWGAAPHLFVIGATDTNDNLTYFSNYGTPVDLVAPGINIYTTTVGGGYRFASGTSLSTPIVTGTAALIYSLKPNFTPTQVEQLILTSAKDLGTPSYDLTYAGGLLNTGLAVEKSTVATPAIILDNLAAGASDSFRTFNGKWCDSPEADPYGNPSLLSCGPRTDTYRFTPSIPQAQTYKIFLRYLSKSNYSRKVPVTIQSASGRTTKQVNMQSNGGTWVALGTYKLRAGDRNFVELSDTAGLVSVDAVMFEPQ